MRFALRFTVTILLFLSILLGLRWLWAEGFATPEHPVASRGVLDLRGWEYPHSRTIPLDGEWEFYPEALLSHGEAASAKRVYAQVPGDWRDALSEVSDSSFGYGTYRLRILVDPTQHRQLAFWLQEVKSAADVEINGQDAGAIGRPAARGGDYQPYYASIVVSHMTQGEQELELLIRAANYENPYEGGILRSIRFGLQEAVDTERWYSIGFQLVTFFLLLLHALYACILFGFLPQERAFLAFILLLVTAALTIVTIHDRLILQWLPLNYIGIRKLGLLSYVWLSFFMLLMARIFSGTTAGAGWFRAYGWALGLYSAFLVAAPMPLIAVSQQYKAFSVFYLAPLIWFVYLIGKMAFRNRHGAIFLLMSAVSVVSSVVWGIFYNGEGVNRIYYPIDVLAAIVGFSAYWFRQYFRNAQERARLNEQLRAADKQKDQFLAQTSHELRTPLHAIINIAQTVASRDKERLDGRSQSDLELLTTVGRRMSHLLDDLLDIVRLQEKRISLHPEPVSVASVVSGVFGMLGFAAEGKDVRMRSDVPADLPPVLADEKRLVQIVLNLVHNALKYTESGTVTVSADVRGNSAVIRVSDTGPGMDEETQARVFLPYEQGRHGDSDGGGFGLGLSICRQLVELHGGRLTVRSAPGEGSEFAFTLPLAGPDQAEAAADGAAGIELRRGESEAAAARLWPDAPVQGWPDPARLPEAPPLSDRIVHILAVDDDPVNLKVLSGILSAETYRVRTAASAREALELLGRQPWDVLIADVMMPHMSGYELTRKVRERFSLAELPVLLLTARSEPADIYAGFMAGANDYVTKPVDGLELRYRIWSLTTLKQSVDDRLRIEAAYLQAQIHPHFLFNTLNSIMALSDLDQSRMRKLGDAFASYLRISYDFLNSSKLVNLSHELDLVRAYLYIEKERFEDRLAVEWEIDPGVQLMLPPLTIQPLVENAVRHGVLSRAKGGTVRIRVVRRDEQSSLIEVADDGKGMEPEQARLVLLPKTERGDRGGGIGLANTHRRLTQLYGSGLTIRSAPGEGTTVSFVVPDPEARGSSPDGSPAVS